MSEQKGCAMPYINWETTFAVNSSTLQPDPNGDWLFPTYGRYGGPDFAEGVFGGNALLDYVDNNNNQTLDFGDTPYTYNQLLADQDPDNDPQDFLDFAFYRHDVFSVVAGNDPAAQAAADLTLAAELFFLEPETFDPSGAASLYAGVTMLAMLYRIETTDPGLLTPAHYLLGLNDAYHDIEYGLNYIL
jgi:hypothetical protein